MNRRLLTTSCALTVVLGVALTIGCGLWPFGAAQTSGPVAKKEPGTTKPPDPSRPVKRAEDPVLLGLAKARARQIAGFFPEKDPRAIRKNKEDYYKEINWDKVFGRAFQIANNARASETLPRFRARIETDLKGPDPIYGRNTSVSPPESPPSSFQPWYVGWITRVVDNAAVTGDLPRRGSYRLVSVHTESDKEAVATFRLILAGSSGVNYHGYRLERTTGANGRETAEVVDVYDYENGETLSDAIRRELILAYGDELSAGPSDPDRALWEDREKLRQMRTAFHEGMNEVTFNTYGSLQPATQKDQATVLLWLRAAGRLEGREFEDALGSFRARTGREPASDPAVSLLSIDAWLRAGKYQEAFHSVESLDRALPEPDLYLNVLRAGILAAGGRDNWKRAEKLAWRVLDAAAKEDPNETGLGKVAVYQAFEVCRQIASVGESPQDVDAAIKGLQDFEAKQLKGRLDLEPKFTKAYQMEDFNRKYEVHEEAVRKAEAAARMPRPDF